MCFGHPNSRSLGGFCSNLVWFGSMKNAVLELRVLQQKCCGHAKIQPGANMFGFFKCFQNREIEINIVVAVALFVPCVLDCSCHEVEEISRCSILLDLSNLLRLGLSDNNYYIDNLEPDAACPVCHCWVMRQHVCDLSMYRRC